MEEGGDGFLHGSYEACVVWTEGRLARRAHFSKLDVQTVLCLHDEFSLRDGMSGIVDRQGLAR